MTAINKIPKETRAELQFATKQSECLVDFGEFDRPPRMAELPCKKPDTEYKGATPNIRMHVTAPRSSGSAGGIFAAPSLMSVATFETNVVMIAGSSTDNLKMPDLQGSAQPSVQDSWAELANQAGIGETSGTYKTPSSSWGFSLEF